MVHSPTCSRVQLDVACQVLEVLHRLHRLTIVHRDVSVCNIMRSRAGTVKLADFGISKMCDNTLRITNGTIIQVRRRPVASVLPICTAVRRFEQMCALLVQMCDCSHLPRFLCQHTRALTALPALRALAQQGVSSGCGRHALPQQRHMYAPPPPPALPRTAGQCALHGAGAGRPSGGLHRPQRHLVLRGEHARGVVRPAAVPQLQPVPNPAGAPPPLHLMAAPAVHGSCNLCVVGVAASGT